MSEYIEEKSIIANPEMISVAKFFADRMLEAVNRKVGELPSRGHDLDNHKPLP